MAVRVGLIRPGNRGNGYQGLARIKAIEPPHWLMVRARQLQEENHYETQIVDMALHGLGDIPDCDEYEIWPTGTHPSAQIQERESVGDLLCALGNCKVTVMDRFVKGMEKYSPLWKDVDPYNYRAHNWHTWGQTGASPYGTLHTSVSCPYNCSFCGIHDYYGRGYWERPVADVLWDLLFLYDIGVRNIKVMDELFATREERIKAICDGIKEVGIDNLNMWVYERVDVLSKVKSFAPMKEAGITWVALGIESGNEEIRKQNNKVFTNQDVVTLVKRLHDDGINVVGNFIYGFPQDNKDTVRETFVLACDSGCDYANFYCMVAYPDTKLDKLAKDKGWYTPLTSQEYAQYSDVFHPLQTDHLTSSQVLAVRDWAFHAYHNTGMYRERIMKKFGESAVADVERMCDIPLQRVLLDGTWQDYYKKRGTRGA
jgi:radical SAM superfamily enzyme YgiQ (UPF0313 family)